MNKLVVCLGIVTGISVVAGVSSGVALAAEPTAGAGGAAAHTMAGHAMMGPSGGAAAKAEHQSCGQMLSSKADLPAKLAEGASSMADMLEAHAALLGKEKEAATEAKGLRSLAKTHRQIAASLTKASEEMKKAASWPAAPHDMEKMKSDPKLAAAMQKSIDVHKEIIALMQKMVAEMEAHQKAK